MLHFALLLGLVYLACANGPISCPLCDSEHSPCTDAKVNTCFGHMCADECFGDDCTRKCISYIPERYASEFETVLTGSSEAVCTGGTDGKSEWSLCACYSEGCLPKDTFVKVNWTASRDYTCRASRPGPYGYCNGGACTMNGGGEKGCEIDDLEVTVLAKPGDLRFSLFPKFVGCIYTEYPGEPVKCSCNGDNCNEAKFNATVNDTTFVNCSTTENTTCEGQYCHIWSNSDGGLTIEKKGCLTLTGTNRLQNGCHQRQYHTTGFQTECICKADMCNADLRTAIACAQNQNCGEEPTSTARTQTTTMPKSTGTKTETTPMKTTSLPVVHTSTKTGSMTVVAAKVVLMLLCLFALAE